MEEDLLVDGIPAISNSQLLLRMNVAGRVGHGAILRGNKLVMWGGSTNNVLLKEGFLVINLETGRKELILDVIFRNETDFTQGLTVPMRRCFATCYSKGAYAVDKNFLYTFGGFLQERNVMINCFFRFEFCQHPRPEDTQRSWIDEIQDVEHQEHIELEILHDFSADQFRVPSPRITHTLFVFEQNVYVFGGFGPDIASYLHDHGEFLTHPDHQHAEDDFMMDCGWNNQLCVYNCKSRHWQNPSTSGNVPSPRASHVMCVVGIGAYLFGGSAGDNDDNFLYHLDLYNLQWTAISLTGDLPPPRIAASLTRIDENALFVFGGIIHDSFAYGDGFILNLTEQRFHRVVQQEEATRRMWHAAVLTNDNRVIVVGGCSPDFVNNQQNLNDDFLQFSVYQPSSLYAACLRHVARNINTYSPAHLEYLNIFIGFDLLNLFRLRHRAPPLSPPRE